MPTLLLIRHAEPAIRGVFLGQMDPPLSPAGMALAQQTLSKIEVTVTYCSPLRRARQTAEFLHSHELIQMADLREMSYGEWTGQTWTEIETRWGALAQQKTADWLNVNAPGGESWQELMARVGSAWRTIRGGPVPAAVVAHQAVNAALASFIDGRDPIAFSQQYGEIHYIDYEFE